MSNVALCIGGELDGKTFTSLPHDYVTHYNMFRIELSPDNSLRIYVHTSVSPTAAVHMVFAAYAKKGKK